MKQYFEKVCCDNRKLGKAHDTNQNWFEQLCSYDIISAEENLTVNIRLQNVEPDFSTEQ